MREVSEFVVVAPGAMGKAVTYAESKIRERLGRSFPDYQFRIEPFGPFSEPDEFAVIPIMGVAGAGGHDPDEVYMCRPLDPWVIPAIKEVLREFELTPGLH